MAAPGPVAAGNAAPNHRPTLSELVERCEAGGANEALEFRSLFEGIRSGHGGGKQNAAKMKALRKRVERALASHHDDQGAPMAVETHEQPALTSHLQT